MPLPTAAELTDQTVTNTQMKDRLGQLVKNIDRSYSSLTEANADIANIEVGVTVTVNAENGGKYYKATASATSLTKSSYDPVDITKAFAKSYTEYTKNIPINSSNPIVKQQRSGIKEMIAAIDNVSSYSNYFDNNIALCNFAINEVSDRKQIKINSYVINILKLDVVKNGLIYTFWDDLTVSGTAAVSQTESNGYRITLTPSFTLNSALISENLVVDLNNVFTPLAQSNLTNATLGVSGHTDGTIVFKIPSSHLIKYGFADSSDGALSFFNTVKENIKLKGRSATQFIRDFELENAFIETGLLTISSDVALTCNINSLSKRAELKVFEKAYTDFSTSVKNNSGIATTSELVELKVNFPESLVFSDAQIVVLDSDGNQYDSQFAPNFYPNLKSGKTLGYYSDQSFKSGSLYLFDSLAVDEVKYFTVRVYESAVRDITTNLVVAKNAGTTAYKNYGYILNFGTALLSSIGIASDNTQLNVAYGSALYVLNSSGGTNSTALARVGDPVVARQGKIFTDIECLCRNKAFNLLTVDDAFESRVRFRLFKNGMIRVVSINKALQDVSAQIVYGLQNTISSINVTYTTEAHSSVYTHQRNGFGGHTFDFVVKYFHGDEHRDGLNYGAKRDAAYSNTHSTTALDMRFGWRDSIGSASSQQWNIAKNTTWMTELDILIDNSIATSQTLVSKLYNQAIGFACEKRPATKTQRLLKQSIKQYIDDVLDFTYSSMGSNPTATQPERPFIAEFVQYLKDGEGDFEELYTNFIIASKTYLNISNLNQAGNAYTTGNTFAMQFASRFISPALQYFYLEAEKQSDTAKIAEMKILIGSLATAMASYVNTKGTGIGGNGAAAINNDYAVSNMVAGTMRFIALGIYAGLDADGAMLTAFNALETRFVHASSNSYTPVLNYPKDTFAIFLSVQRWLHYSMYAINQYAQAILLLKRTPVFDLTQMALESFNSDGSPKDFIWCRSESRRGGRNTLGFALSALTYKNHDGCINAALKVMQTLNKEMWSSTGEYERLYDFNSLTASNAANAKVADDTFTLISICDVYLAYHFKLLS